MKTLFAPGCALRRYKPASVDAVFRFLRERGLADELYTVCCKETAPSAEPLRIIECCPGCSHKFELLFPHAQVVSLWKILLETDFPFPDYGGQRMSIHDSCPARLRYNEEMQETSRAVCRRMNITLIEPPHTRGNTVCCGGSTKDYDTRVRMACARAAEFPEKDVVTYCTGCTRSLSVTPVRPRLLFDLIFREPTQGLTIPKP